MIKNSEPTRFRFLLVWSMMLLTAIGTAAQGAQPATLSKPLAPSNAANLRKLERIIIPKLEVREAPIREVIDYVKKKSVECDVDSPPGARGLNIKLNLESSRFAAGLDAASPDAVPAIPGLDPAPVGAKGIGGAPTTVAENPADVHITISLSNVSLLEALREVTALAGLKLKIDPDWVRIVLPEDGDRADGPDQPKGETIAPALVEIESRFVEVPQDELKDITADDWIMDFFNAPHNKGNATTANDHGSSLESRVFSNTAVGPRLSDGAIVRIFSDPQISVGHPWL